MSLKTQVLREGTPMARLERNLDYQHVALIELLGQPSYYLIAFPMAFQLSGVWALVARWWLQPLQPLVLLYWNVGYRPRLHY